MRRTFDLLSAPVPAGVSGTTGANMSWAGSTSPAVVVASDVVNDFRVDAVSSQGAFVLVAFTNVSKSEARFAATVTTATDEKTVEDPGRAEYAADRWPALKASTRPGKQYADVKVQE